MTEKWPLIKAKYLLTRQNHPANEEDGTVTAFRDGEVVLRSERRTEGFTEAEKYIGYQGVRPGELVVHSMDAFAGAIGLSKSIGKMSPVVHIYRAGDEVDLRFYSYFLRHLAKSGYIQSLSKGIRERSTAFDPAMLSQLELPKPSMEEQRRISDFLDAQIANIEALRATRIQHISAISDVSQSLLADIFLSKVGEKVRLKRMIKDERLGIWGEEMGEAPMEVSVARVADFNRRKFILGEVKSIRSVEVKQFLPRRVLRGDILLERSGGGEKSPVGCAVQVVESIPNLVCSNFVSRIRTVEGVDPDYLSLVLAALYTNGLQKPHSSQTTGIQNLDTESYFQTQVPKVPFNMQLELRTYGRKVIDTTSKMVSELEKSLSLAEELKFSLIAAAVTGDLDTTTSRSVA